MRILHVASECAPLAKAGGLADVVFGLSRQCHADGHDCTAALPHYAGLFAACPTSLVCTVQVPCREGKVPVRVFSTKAAGVPLLLFDDGAHGLLTRPQLYGYPDDTRRMVFFCLAVAAYLRCAEPRYDVVHLHDWPAALLAGLLYPPHQRPVGGVCLTLHNLESQGLAGEDLFEEFHLVMGTPRAWWHDSLRAGGLNLLQGGIHAADTVTTVSPTYAKEILRAPGGKGLEAVLRAHHGKVHGVLNGIDYGYWNPANDPLLPLHYSQDDLVEARLARARIKTLLQKRLRLDEDPHRPLFVTVSRLTTQKGPELMQHAIRKVVAMGGEYVLQGSSPIESIQEAFHQQKVQLAGSRRAHLHLMPEEELTHWLFAAADFIVIPSVFEPCGLTQMLGMRYGAVPIVRRTGGLADTVHDYEHSHSGVQKNGLVFEHADFAAVDWALMRAFHLYRYAPHTLAELQQVGMQSDFSWLHPAKMYLRLYRESCLAS